MKMTLETLKNSINVLAEKVNAPKNLLPPINCIQEGNSVELDEFNNLYYVISERGDVERSLMMDLDELLYHVFSDITFIMSMHFELNNRKDGQDVRRIMFQKQEELLGQLKNEWKDKVKKEHDYILGYAPFQGRQINRE